MPAGPAERRTLPAPAAGPADAAHPSGGQCGRGRDAGRPRRRHLGDAAAAAAHLSGLAPHVIVTAGASGLAIASGAETVSVPAEKVRAVSSHGAGDAFIGALAAGLLRGDPLPLAAATAARAAARHVAGLPPA
ncbi:MAG: PfkB family carbohydrate kinase [Paracoccaceae bacterium]